MGEVPAVPLCPIQMIVTRSCVSVTGGTIPTTQQSQQTPPTQIRASLAMTTVSNVQTQLIDAIFAQIMLSGSGMTTASILAHITMFRTQLLVYVSSIKPLTFLSLKSIMKTVMYLSLKRKMVLVGNATEIATHALGSLLTSVLPVCWVCIYPEEIPLTGNHST